MLLHPDQLFDRGIERLGEPYVGGLVGMQLTFMERHDAMRAKKRGCMTKRVSYSDKPEREPSKASKASKASKENSPKGQSVAGARKHCQ